MSNMKTEERTLRTTPLAKPGEIERKWYILDATGISLGRLSTAAATILRGKNKPQFTPNTDTGDFVIIINADKLVLTGKKATDKIYYRHSDYPGGLKSISAGELLAKSPKKLVEKSVKGMLPKNSLGHDQLLKLHVYAGAEHEQAAQKPVLLDINTLI